MTDRSMPRPRPPVTFPINELEIAIFGLHGEPFGTTLRLAIGGIAAMSADDPEASRLLTRITNAMNPKNAIWTFRNIFGEVTPGGWIDTTLRTRMQDLGFLFTFATNDDDWDTPVAFLKRDKERITYVHRRDSRVWVSAGDEVIVPMIPRGVRLSGSRRKGSSAYLLTLQPARPWRRAA